MFVPRTARLAAELSTEFGASPTQDPATPRTRPHPEPRGTGRSDARELAAYRDRIRLPLERLLILYPFESIHSTTSHPQWDLLESSIIIIFG